MTDTILLDSSVIVAAYLSPTVRSMVVALSKQVMVGYPGAYLKLDIDRSKLPGSLKRHVLAWARANLEDAGELSYSEEARVFGRYGRWVKRIGRWMLP